MVNDKPTYEELEKRVEELENREKEFYILQNDLIKSNSLLNIFIDNSPIHAYIKEISDNESKVLYASENFEQMIGIRGSEMIGKNMFDLFSPEFAQKYTDDDIHVVLNSVNLKLFEDFQDKNYVTYKYPIHINGTKLLAGYTIDITELKNIQNQLFEQNKNLDKLIEQRTIEINRKNIELQQAKEKAEDSVQEHWNLIETLGEGFLRANVNGYITKANNLVAKLTECNSPEELIGIHITSLYANPSDRDIMIKELKEKEILFNYELLLRTKNGKTFWTLSNIKLVRDKNGKIIGNEGIIRDISHFKKAELELTIAREKAELTEQLFHNILENFPGVVFWKDTNLNYIGCNQTFANAAGLQFAHEIKGKSDFDLPWGETDAIKYREDDIEVITGVKSKLNIIEKQLQAHGRVVWFNTSKIPLRDAIGNIYGILGVSHDITKQKKIESNLIQAKEKAEESDRLKTAFLNNMSHEVRTPLNAISGFSQLITRANQSEENLKSFSEIILRSSNKLIEIITDVVEISKIQTKQIKVSKKECFCNTLISNDIKDNFEFKAKEKNIALKIEKDCICGDYPVLIDIEKFTSIVNHLVDNAIKFTISGEVKYGCNRLSNALQITVSDTGIGISPDMQKIIFEPFRQIEITDTRTFGGNGLGLAIVKAYVELLNGEIKLHSEINKGTTFIITIPVTYTSDIVETAKPMHKKHNVKTVLITEDEDSNYQYLLALLEELNLNILYAANGQQAVDLCRSNSEIDLILMDIKMPIMDGHTAASMIKNFRSDIPIIAQTAYALESEKEKYSGIFDDYITKPIDRELLFMKLMYFFN